jgi:hypothetical protein
MPRIPEQQLMRSSDISWNIRVLHGVDPHPPQESSCNGGKEADWNWDWETAEQ